MTFKNDAPDTRKNLTAAGIAGGGVLALMTVLSSLGTTHPAQASAQAETQRVVAPAAQDVAGDLVIEIKANAQDAAAMITTD